MAGSILSQTEGIVLLVVFGIAMIALVLYKTPNEKHADGFLVADRDVSVWQGAFSIAVSWIWAPAIFICSLFVLETSYGERSILGDCRFIASRNTSIYLRKH